MINKFPILNEEIFKSTRNENVGTAGL